MWVREGKQVVPVFLIESSKGREDEDGFLVANWVGSRRYIVEMIMHDRRWFIHRFQGCVLFDERGRGRR